MTHRLALTAALLVLLASAGCGGSKDKSTAPPGATLALSQDLTAMGGQYSHRFFTAGAYPYHCRFHDSMTGIVIVAASTPAVDSLQSVDVANFAFSPASVSIPVGGKVTWTNTSNMTHSVTSN